MNKQRLLKRFLQYVRIDTTAVEDTENYPSSPGQMKLGQLLVEQMEAMGITDAQQDQKHQERHRHYQCESPRGVRARESMRTGCWANVHEVWKLPCQAGIPVQP